MVFRLTFSPLQIFDTDMSTQLSRGTSDLKITEREGMKTVEFPNGIHDVSSGNMKGMCSQRLAHRDNDMFILLPWSFVGKKVQIF